MVIIRITIVIIVVIIVGTEWYPIKIGGLDSCIGGLTIPVI